MNKDQGENTNVSIDKVETWKRFFMQPGGWVQKTLKLLRTPKGFVLPILLLLIVVSFPAVGVGPVVVTVGGAVLSAVVVDMSIAYILRREYIFPSGAIITGLIIAMVLSPQEPWYIPLITSAIAILSKHLLKTRRRPIFNPAALGLFFAGIFLPGGQSWWGGLAMLSPWWLILLCVVGYLTVNRVNKFPQVLVYTGLYFLFFTFIALMGNDGATKVAEIFQVPFVNAVLFFVFFMLTDPPTSPGPSDEQIQFGMITSLSSVLTFIIFGSLTFLFVGLLIGNALLAWERTSSRSNEYAREKISEQVVNTK